MMEKEAEGDDADSDLPAPWDQTLERRPCRSGGLGLRRLTPGGGLGHRAGLSHLSPLPSNLITWVSVSVRDPLGTTSKPASNAAAPVSSLT